MRSLIRLDTAIRRSRFAFEFINGPIAALYHSLTLKKLYMPVETLSLYRHFASPKTPAQVLALYNESEQPEIQQAIDQLLRTGFLVPEDWDETEAFDSVRGFLLPKPHIDCMYLIPTNDCNFDCRYCLVERNMPAQLRSARMTEDTAKQAIDFFARCAAKDSFGKEIVFYGGEPLLNWEVVQFAISYAREVHQKGGFGDAPLRLALLTNGTLMTRDRAKFLADNGVEIDVSIDGPSEIHDLMRFFRGSNQPTYNHTLRGYRIAQEFTSPGISCTVASHNVEVLDEVTRFFATELKPSGLGFNILVAVDESDPAYVPIERVTMKIIDAYKVAREYGLFEDRVMRRIRAFVEESVRFYDCAGCGRQIVVTPDGRVGPCQAFLGSRDFFVGTVYDDLDIEGHPVFNEWSKRSPFNMPQCYDCPAIAICGGGCPADAYLRTGSLWEVDRRMCIHCTMLLEWMIWDQWALLQSKSSLPGGISPEV